MCLFRPHAVNFLSFTVQYGAYCYLTSTPRVCQYWDSEYSYLITQWPTIQDFILDFSVSQSGYYKCTALSYRSSAELSTHGAGGRVYLCGGWKGKQSV